MLSKFRTRLLPVLALLLLLASCSKSNKQGKYIPEDVIFAIHINGKSINSKLPWEEVKKISLFEKIYSDSSLSPLMKSILDNPENSGIDIGSDMVIFVQMDSAGGLAAFQGSLKDAEKFKKFNLEASKGAEVTEKDGIQFISRSPVIAGWNKEKFVYMTGVPGMKSQSMIQFDENEDPKTRNLASSCKAIFDLKEKNSLGSNEKFTDLMKKEGDLHFWLNTEQLYKNAGGMGAMEMINMDKFLKGNINVGTANFENGKINLNYKSYMGKDLTAVFKKFSSGSINEDMLKRIPSKDVAAVLALHFNPDGIKELVTLTGFEGIINMGLMTMGFSIDDFVKANKGDIMIALMDIRSKKDSLAFIGRDGKRSFNYYSTTEPDYLFTASIGDKDAFNKLIRAFKKMTKDKMEPDDSTVSYNSNDKYFAFGNSKSNVDTYLGSSTNSFDFISKIAGNPMGGYVNLQYIMKSMNNEIVKDSSSKIIYDASLKFWDNIFLKGGNYADGGFSYDIEINLVDKNNNSLKQLSQYMGLIGEVMTNKMKDEKSYYKMDEIVNDTKTTTVPPHKKL